jgi:hypothetical protein
MTDVIALNEQIPSNHPFGHEKLEVFMHETGRGNQHWINDEFSRLDDL